MANISTSVVTFSILSPGASLSYDRIKLRLEEYRTLLASDSDTIELSTENGKTLICRKKAKEMEEYLDQAEILLRDVVQSRDISTLVVLHHLCDLAEVLDNLKLYDECRLTGNCALSLAEALGRQSFEFKSEQADTLAIIARLSVYEPCARTLFIQAVSICEEVVANNASHSNKLRFLYALSRAGRGAVDPLGGRLMERAVQLMTKELPPTMVRPDSRGAIYTNYGNVLLRLKQYTNATKAFQESISIHRILVYHNPAKYNYPLVSTLLNMSQALHGLGRYNDAIAAYKEVLDICPAISALDPLQYNDLMTDALHGYGATLLKLKQYSEALVVQKQSISFYRNLTQTWNKGTPQLYGALCNYGTTCYSLGKHAEAVHAYQESILLFRAARDPEEEGFLSLALHNIANSYNALGQCVEANAAAIEALERNHGNVFEWCDSATDFKSCFVCQRVVTRVHRRRDKILGLFRGNRTQ